MIEHKFVYVKCGFFLRFERFSSYSDF